MRPNLLGRVHPMIQICDEGGNRAFKVDVVFPQSVVRVKQQRLPGVDARWKLRVRFHPSDCIGNRKPRCYTRLNSPMTNFMVSDIVGAVRALAGFTCLLFAPGYLLAASLNLFDFRTRNLLERMAWAIALSFAVSPIVAILVGRITSIGTVAIVFEFGTAVVFVLLAVGYRGLRFPHDRNVLALFLCIAVGVAIVLASLVDIQVGHRLFLSVSVLDQAYRVAFTNAIAHAGIPPMNPLYHPGAETPMRYYYFWYALCAVCMKIAHTSARQALMASSCWAAIGLVAAIALYARHFLQVTERLNRFILVAVLLLAVTGLDLLPALYNMFVLHDFAGDMEWWSGDQVTSWFDSILWVPNHTAALLACLTAFLLLWRSRSAILPRDRVAATLLAGIAAASAFGLSIYVAAGFALLTALWCASLVLRRRDTRAALRVAAAVALATLLLLPFLRDLLRSHSATAAGTSAAPRHLFEFGVRKMIDPELLTQLPLLAGVNSRHPVLLDQAVRLVLLLPGYALELGFFGLILILALRSRKSLMPAYAMALGLSLGGLILISFVRSAVIGNNDFGYRAALIPSFFLLLLAAHRMTSAGCRGLLTFLLLVGVAGTCFQATMLRLYIPRRVAIGVKGFTGLPQAAYRARAGYASMASLIPNNAIVQSNLVDPANYFNVINLLYSERAMATDGALDCGAVFGGDPASCGSARRILQRIFTSPAPSGEVTQSLCRSLGIGYLAVAQRDQAWHDTTGWVWTLPYVTSGQASQSHATESSGAGFRVVQCGTGTGSPP